MMFPFRFEFIPYPLWRRQFPPLVNALIHTGICAVRGDLVAADNQPPMDAGHMAHFLTRWKLLPYGMDAADIKAAILRHESVAVLTAPDQTESDHTDAIQSPPDAPLRLPAQWEAMERVIVNFPVLYPPMWETHSAMIAAISAVAGVDVIIPHRGWAATIRAVCDRLPIRWENVRFIHLRTDDIWVRDHGPIIGIDPYGNRVAVDAIFDPLETYPQADDDTMPARWGATANMDVHALDLHMEGGNMWSDGAGTLIMSREIIERHAALGMSAADVEAVLHRWFDYEKLILTPYLWREETKHVDLLIKLVDARTVLVGASTPAGNRAPLRETAELFRRETNARGDRYRVIELPTPDGYLNAGVYPVWRSYTNALTVNGRVLVPVFGIRQDAEALAIYRAAMPGCEILPIPCAAAANGGGGVHCLTKEVPAGC